MQDFVVINFGVYFGAESLYIFLETPDKVEKYAKMVQSNSFDNCVHRYDIEISNIFEPGLQLINTKH